MTRLWRPTASGPVGRVSMSVAVGEGRILLPIHGEPGVQPDCREQAGDGQHETTAQQGMLNQAHGSTWT